jgi:uncharacterized glyoxalase superfamily protein PhnB
MESLSPNIFVNDMNQTIEFYKSIGFSVIMTVPEAGNNFDWAMMMNGNVTIMFQTFVSLGEELPQVSRHNGASMLFYIKLPKIREFFELIKDKVTIVTPLNKTFYGATEFVIVDNNNYLLTFAEDEA